MIKFIKMFGSSRVFPESGRPYASLELVISDDADLVLDHQAENSSKFCSKSRGLLVSGTGQHDAFVNQQPLGLIISFHIFHYV